MGLANRKRRRGIREDAPAENAESADDVGMMELSHDGDEATTRISDEFCDSPESPHLALVMPPAPTGKHVTLFKF